MKVADNLIKIRSLAWIGMHNRHVKCGRKIPNRFRKIATKPYGGFIRLTLYIAEEVRIKSLPPQLKSIGRFYFTFSAVHPENAIVRE